jgi:non-specific serine/threonine protein kinase
MARLEAVIHDQTLRDHSTGRAISVGSPEWFAWLEEATVFAYVRGDTRITVRKEARARGDRYWRAYRKEGGRLRRAYLGKSAHVTLAKLVAAAAALSGPSAVPHASVALAPEADRLPEAPSPLHGRERDVRSALALLEEGARVLTLTGPGGVGKTALALTLARLARDAGHYTQGVWFVDLSPLRDPDLVATTVGRVLGVRDEGQPSIDLVYALRNKHLLVVLDNCEQVVAGAAAVAQLTQTCPGLVVVATSRQPLGLRVEQEFPVPLLPVPTTGADKRQATLFDNSSVQLFEQRARRVDPTFALDERNIRSVAAVCARLDGLPLALELAAAQVKYMAPAALRESLRTRLNLLSRAIDVPARHRSLREAIGWSVTRLTPSERAVFRRLGVFAGGCTFSAAEAVCSLDASESSLPLLTSLIDKNLVQRDDRSESGEPRFRMLETIRESALEDLALTDELEPTRRKHAEFFTAYVEGLESASMPVAIQGSLGQMLDADRGPAWPQHVALRLIAQDVDNLRDALSWAAGRGETRLALRLSTVSYWYWLFVGQNAEGRAWLETALRSPRCDRWPVLWARALAGAAGTQLRMGARPAIALAEQALGVAEAADDPRVQGHAHFILALAAVQEGDDRRAAEHARATLDVAKSSGQSYWEANALLVEAGILERSGAAPRAGAALERALGLHEAIGNLWGIARTRTLFGALALREHNVERACWLVLGALRAYQALDSTWLEPECFEILAGVMTARQKAEVAARLLGASGSLHRVPHARFAATDQTGPRAASLVQLGQPEFDRLHAEGAALSPRAAVAFALSACAEPTGTARTRSKLTRRELEVAALVARGLTSREIAEALVISVRTADSHADHIRDKLGLRSRAEIASWASVRLLGN